MKYGSLNLKSDYSLLKSLIKINDLIDYAKINNINVLSLCDDNLCGSLEFYNACKLNNIKCIIGLEYIYENEKIYLFCKNYNGFKNLLLISRYGLKDCDDIILIGNKKIFNFEFYNINDLYFKEIKSLDKNNEGALKYLEAISLNQNINNIENISDVSFEIIKDENVEKIINSINLDLEHKEEILKYSDCDSYKLLKEKILEGTKKKFGSTIPKKYLDRIKYELNIINKMGFCDYFLIVYDYVKYAKDNGILVGPGRGSAAGSLISYVLDITEVDPLKYDLLFERFLNIERVTMPDIDIDFEFDRREEVINYCKNKYGNDRVANIIAFGTLKSRAVIRDLGRVMNIDVNNLSKAINPNISLKDNYENAKKYLSTYDLKKLYKLGLLLEGLKRNITMHAAGIVMSNNDLANSVPLIYNGSDYISGYTPEYLEQIGLLKMDFLGLKNLSILRDSIERVKKIDHDFDIYNIPLNDRITLDLFKNGNTLGIFQFESSGMINFLKRLDVNSFDDIVVANALFRPGPANNIDLYINYKSGKLKPNYYDDRLKSILEPTYGVMIYQEQIMLISNVMAGYSLGDADILRRAMSKKKESVMEKSYETFVSGSLKNGYSLDIIKKVYDDIKKFAQYGFNKSHSVSYALLAYRMAYIKAHYKECFYVSLLSYFNGDEKINDYIYEARLNGVNINRPDINISSNVYECFNNKVYLPITSIKGVGSGFVNSLIEERKKGLFLNIFDFVKRVKVNKNILESLISCGVFDSFEYNRRTLLSSLDLICNYAELGDLVDESSFELSNYEEFSRKEMMILEKDYLGISFGNDLINEYSIKYERFVSLSDIHKYFDKDVDIVVMVNRIKKTKTKNNDYMAFMDGTDNINKISIVLFKETVDLINSIENNDIVHIFGHVEKRFNNYQVVVKNIEKLD